MGYVLFDRVAEKANKQNTVVYIKKVCLTPVHRIILFDTIMSTKQGWTKTTAVQDTRQKIDTVVLYQANLFNARPSYHIV